MYVDFPWHFDARGRTAVADDANHVRDMVKLVVLTHLGERVNRPGFGCGLHQLVFAPNSPDLAAALRFTVQAALQQELSDLLTLESLEVVVDEGSLRVELSYVLLATADREEMAAELGGAP